VRKCQDNRAVQRETELLQAGADDREALVKLLGERKKRKQEIRNEVESLRKMAGSANLGFSQAIEVQESLEQAKNRLAMIEEGIREIESKLK
jgi:hypothetical protein